MTEEKSTKVINVQYQPVYDELKEALNGSLRKLSQQQRSQMMGDACNRSGNAE